MKIIGVIPARYNSTRFPGKPLADICGKPMIWWVYNQAKKVKEIDELIVATDDKRIIEVCKKYNINAVMTSQHHNTPTSRLYEISTYFDANYYVFIGGDEPLIEPESISIVIKSALNTNEEVSNAMTTIKTAPEVLDYTNIKIVTNTKGYALYTTRSPLPYPKGGLNFDYKKFVGIGVFSKKALNIYNNTPKSNLEKIEECDLIRFLDINIPIKMINVDYYDVSVDTKKDLEFVINLIKNKEKING
ncbi:MAG: 3-deoxy-manno-octulosonate cytidylyltransferase [Clostridia bacterium]|nr:3-deoxy-manno-octulosonate cytidylyltransferase [Clostridia bacterium]